MQEKINNQLWIKYKNSPFTYLKNYKDNMKLKDYNIDL